MLQINNVVSVNDIIYNREKKEIKAYYKVQLFKVHNDKWIEVKLYWEGFSKGSMTNVHVYWIKDDYARKRDDSNYNKDIWVIHLESEYEVPRTAWIMPDI